MFTAIFTGYNARFNLEKVKVQLSMAMMIPFSMAVRRVLMFALTVL
jgi:hypothetical protein